jgi:hypothetical protein
MTQRRRYLTARDAVVLASGLDDAEISRRWRLGEGFPLPKGKGKLTRARAEEKGLEWVFFIEREAREGGKTLLAHAIQAQREEPDAWLSELAERMPGGAGA